MNFNLYHYAGNNPIVYTDPDGRDDRRKSSPDDLVTSMIEPHEFYSLDTDSVKNTIFSNIMRESVGAKYSHDRPPTSEKMDCSGAFVYALQKMGYDVPANLTADDMATGKFEGIKITDKVDNSKQGEKGYLNFYKWGTSKFQHVNYGVGRKGNETEKQVVDASAQGTTWETNRNGQRKRQKPAAIPGKINKTWAPFSNRHTPDRQAIIDWSKLKRKVNDDE